MRKSIKNYTTTIAVSKTIGEIQDLLVSKGAEKIMIDYESGKPTSLMFLLKTDKKMIPVKLPARIKNIQGIFLSKKKPRHNWMNPEPLTVKEIEQSERTA